MFSSNPSSTTAARTNSRISLKLSYKGCTTTIPIQPPPRHLIYETTDWLQAGMNIGPSLCCYRVTTGNLNAPPTQRSPDIVGIKVEIWCIKELCVYKFIIQTHQLLMVTVTITTTNKNITILQRDSNMTWHICVSVISKVKITNLFVYIISGLAS